MGYELRRTSNTETQKTGDFKLFELYSYNKPDGTFDYERYKRIQTKGNKQKIENVWVSEENIAFLSSYIKKHVGTAEFGICHGTRRGKEQEWFRKYLNCDVIGTEISDNAESFPHTIQWDFHEMKSEWEGSADFIYSNSFDHTYDPSKCLNTWMSCVKRGGICIIEHTSYHQHAKELDPFGASIVYMPYLILLWGKGGFFVKEILDAPSRQLNNQKDPEQQCEFSKFLIIKKD